MKLKRVLVSVKKTAFEHLTESSKIKDLPPGELQKIKKSHDEHSSSLVLVSSILRKRGIEPEIRFTQNSGFDDFRNRDLVVSLGGDGTILKSARCIVDNTPLLSVKSDSYSSGSLCTIDSSRFEEALDRILKGDLRIEKWTRAEGATTDMWLLALNELYIGHKFSSGMARYELSFRDKVDDQMSSGVVVSTGTGSTGWYANLLNSEGPFPRTSEELKFCVREYKKDAGYKQTKGTIRRGETLLLRSNMNLDGCIILDGDSEKQLYDFKRGGLLEIGVSYNPLYVLMFD